MAKDKVITWEDETDCVRIEKQDLVRLTAEWITDKYDIVTTREYENGEVSSAEIKTEPIDKNLWWHILHEEGPWE